MPCYDIVRSSPTSSPLSSFPSSLLLSGLAIYQAKRLLACLLLPQTGLDSGLEGLWVRADDLADLLLVLEQEEGGHGADAEVLGDVGDLVDVELEEARRGVGAGHPGWGG